VNWAPFSCHGKINPAFCNLGSLPSIAAQFIELPFSSLWGCRRQPKQSRGGYEIAAHLSGASNDSGKQPYKSGNYKNLEVKYEDNT